MRAQASCKAKLCFRHEGANVAPDPRPNLPGIVDMVEKGFELSGASNTPIFMMRIRGCHVTGEFVARDNVATPTTHRPESRAREKFCRPLCINGSGKNC